MPASRPATRTRRRAPSRPAPRAGSPARRPVGRVGSAAAAQWVTGAGRTRARCSACSSVTSWGKRDPCGRDCGRCLSRTDVYRPPPTVAGGLRSIRRSIEHMYDVRAGVRTKSSGNRATVRKAHGHVRSDTRSNRCLKRPLFCSNVVVPHDDPSGGEAPAKHRWDQPGEEHEGHRASRRTARQHRAHRAPAAHPVVPARVDREARLPAEHPRDRRAGRAGVVLVGRLPAARARGEGLHPARPQPAAGARGVPARADGGPPLARHTPTRRRTTRPASATRCPQRRQRPDGRPDRGRWTDPGRGAGRGVLPAAEDPGRRRHPVPARGGRRLDDRRGDLQRRLRRDPAAADRGQRRDRGRADRRRGDGEDVPEARTARSGCSRTTRPTSRSTATRPPSSAR